MDRVEYRKEPFSHIYPIINQELIKITSKLDIFSLTYNIYEGKLRDDDILILEANSASAISRMSHEIAVMRFFFFFFNSFVYFFEKINRIQCKKYDWKSP